MDNAIIHWVNHYPVDSVVCFVNTYMYSSYWITIYSHSRKTMNTRENFWSVYCFSTNQMRNETAKDNRQTAALISHNLTRNNKLAFLLQEIFNFAVFKYCSFSFLISALVSQRIEMNDILRKSDVKSRRDRISRSDRARQRIWGREKMSQSQAVFLWVCFTHSSKGHATWLWLVVFDPYFIVAEKLLPMMPTCTVVNFHNLPSLLGQFRSLVFEQMESSDWC